MPRMSDSDGVNQVDETLRTTERSLDAQITLCAGLAQTALAHLGNWPNVSALAGVDRVVDTLRTLLTEAKRLDTAGRPDTHVRLTAILNDVTAARATWAQTLGVLVALDRGDAERLTEHRNLAVEQQEERNHERLIQGQTQAEARKKLL